MKKYGIFAAALVLSVSLLTGCGCTPQKETTPAAPNRPTTGMTPTETTPSMPEIMPSESMATESATIPENNFASTPSEEATTTATEGNPGEQGNSGMEGRTRNRRMG